MKIFLQTIATLMLLAPSTYAAVDSETEEGFMTPAQLTEQNQVMKFLGVQGQPRPIEDRHPPIHRPPVRPVRPIRPPIVVRPPPVHPPVGRPPIFPVGVSHVQCLARDHRDVFYDAIGIYPAAVQQEALNKCRRLSWGCESRGCHNI